MKRIAFIALGLAVAFGTVGCGSSTDTPAASTGAISSLTTLPSVDSMVQGGSTDVSADGSLSALVSGATNAPLLIDITAASAETYFWKSDTVAGNLIDDITSDPTLVDTDPDVQSGYWLGEGSCRMAQMVGYAMQNIKQAGTSTCYMKNMPDAIGVEGLTVAAGSAAITDPNTLFDKQADDVVVQVNASGAPAGGEGEAGDMVVFIKVTGTNNLSDANDYSVDLWFCGAASVTEDPNGYETIRYDDSAGTLAQTSVNTGFGTFGSAFNANVTLDSGGTPIFDTATARSATMTFVDESGRIRKAFVSVSGDLLSAKEYFTYNDQVRKNYAVAQYNGNSMSELKFLQAGYKGSDNGDGSGNAWTYEGGTEFQTDHYQGLSMISDLADADLASTVDAFAFASDSFFDTAPSAGDVGTATLTDGTYSCAPTVNYTVAMDFTTAAVMAVSEQCENDFQDMNFCDSDAINAIRNQMF